ncbi:hypothetical protein L6232_23360, partial [Shewanella sp. C31]|nr:hypothetical protein [Shewanella electrica]
LVRAIIFCQLGFHVQGKGLYYRCMCPGASNESKRIIRNEELPSRNVHTLPQELHVLEVPWMLAPQEGQEE